MKQIEQEKQVLNSLNSLLFDLHYSLAVNAACNGDYSLASKYITKLIRQNGEKPVLLDLNAKINAQQGNFKQAEFLWQKCLKIEPENRTYNAALARLHKIQQRNAEGNLNKLTVIGGIAALALLLILLFNNSRRNKDITKAISTLEKKQTDLIVILNKQEESKQEVVADSLLLFLSKELNKIDGIKVQQNLSEIKIHFTNGLFNTADQLIPDQKLVIASLAKALEPYSDKISVLILGCTDNTPITDSTRFNSNNALSIARASEVYNVFYAESRFLTKNLIIGSSMETDTPFKNDTEENKRKNRSVIIKIKHPLISIIDHEKH